MHRCVCVCIHYYVVNLGILYKTIKLKIWKDRILIYKYNILYKEDTDKKKKTSSNKQTLNVGLKYSLLS